MNDSTGSTPDAAHDPQHGPRGKYLALLSLGALGVVYGDIGTSPLYALRFCFHGPHAVSATPANVLGVLSLIVWALFIVISLKYLVFVVRADNRGEGGIMALMSLIAPKSEARMGRRWVLASMGLFGAALLYGDGVITPAITVLSAIEGLTVVTPVFNSYVIPLAIVILFILFAIQRRGTAGIGAIFGPFNLLWFLSIALLGLPMVLRYPQVLSAFNPWYAVQFFVSNQWHAFLTLGSVFLVVTGGEALYADMGHFGARPIKLAWFTIALPALLLNYLGQGALLLQNPEARENPFFLLAPGWAVLPLVIMATIAASVASQAVISGAFSLTRQAVQLGYTPRVTIQHTSAREIGQIYIPKVNTALMVATIGLVLAFRSSEALAAAYGIAVTTTMVITTILLYFVARELWHWKLVPALIFVVFFLTIDLAFFGANVLKIASGGWFPLALAGVIFTVMTTWRRGRQVLDERLRKDALPIDLFISSVAATPPIRVPGTALFLNRNPEGTPQALLHNLKHNRVLHERVILMTVYTEERPHVDREERVRAEYLGHGIHRVMVRFGYQDDQNLPDVFSSIEQPELRLDPMQVSFFLGRETLIARKNPGMAMWREKLFISMNKNARSAADFFGLPPNRIVELGAQLEL